jgi:hypothetical protein
MSSIKIQKLLRKTRRSRGRKAEFYVIELTSAADQPTEFYIGEELTSDQHHNFRSLLYDDFPELLQPLDSPPLSRQWDHPIETARPMKRQRLNILSSAERTELNRQLKDAVDAGLIRPNYSELGSPILFVRRAHGSLRMCTVALMKLRVKMPTHFRVLTTHSMSLKTQTCTLISTSPHAYGKFEYVTIISAFQTSDGLMEWVAMPFGMCNAPATFKRMMNDILRDFINKFVTVYLDDVCNLK